MTGLEKKFWTFNFFFFFDQVSWGDDLSKTSSSDVITRDLDYFMEDMTPPTQLPSEGR